MEGLAKSFFKLQKNLGSFTNGQVTIVDQDDNLEWFKVEVYPNDGPYVFGKFEFEIRLADFPDSPPVINCLTDIFHPNIDSTYQCEDSGNICVSMLDDWGDNSHDLEDIIQCLLFLLYNPNLADPLSSCCNTQDDVVFTEQVRQSLLGRLSFEDHDVSAEFLTPNFHLPEGECIEDYLIIKPLFHDVALESEEKEKENTESENVTAGNATETPSNDDVEESMASGTLSRQQSKVERPIVEDRVVETPSTALRVSRMMPQFVYKELAEITVTTAVNLVFSGLTAPAYNSLFR